MNKTRYVVRLPQAVVIDTSVCEENCNLSLIEWVMRVRRGDNVPRSYNFKWHNGDNANVDHCELFGRFTRETSRGDTMSVNLCVSMYPSYYCTMEEFMKLFRIGNQCWCISSVINVL